MSGDRTVLQLEKDIWEALGIAAQVYRRSGDLWIETSLTDDWTLNRQNKEGEAFSKLMLERRPMDQWQEDNKTDEE